MYQIRATRVVMAKVADGPANFLQRKTRPYHNMFIS